ncbi:hypothetical protein [Alishewanella longhuensis]
MNNKIFILALLSSHSAVFASSQCSNFTGEIVQKVSFSEAYNAVTPHAPKDEFETTEQYNSRS